MVKASYSELDRHELQPGMFISLPFHKTFGCILNTAEAHYGSEQAIRVLLQEDPDDESTGQWYNLDIVNYPGCYEIED